MKFNNKELFKKYDIYADDYTDYPHKRNWKESFENKDYKDALIKTFRDNESPTLFYAHTPFCKKLCYFCICHKEITNDYNKIKDHLDNYLSKEIRLMGDFIRDNSLNMNFKEIFLGGGSPTLLKEPEFDKLVDLMSRFLDIKKLDRFCVEVDPRTSSYEQIKYYISKGVNNISIGIQDFEPKVQKAVNRVQSIESLENILTEDIRDKIKNINFDFMIGLPFQTAKTMKRSMEQTISLGADRVSLCFWHYVTKFYPHMKLLEEDMPNFYQRKEIFQSGVDTLLENGYVRTGFEHFAKKGTLVANALKNKEATYTSLGAIGKTTNVIATGRSGHSILGDNYLVQNFYEQELYGKALDENKFPIYRGMKLKKDDSIRRSIIRQLRTYFEIDIDNNFNEYFKKEVKMLNEFEKDNLIKIAKDKLIITEDGKLFTDLIISVFDNYLKAKRWNQIEK